MKGLPADWKKRLALEGFEDLETFVEEERKKHSVFPPRQQVFNAFERTPFENVRVVILGQDPYHGEGQAHGLAFSVPHGVQKPPSLSNMHKELSNDLGVEIPEHGNLEAWADQGVLLLNTVLTVREGEPGSHAGKGWERFTDAVIEALVAQERPIVFVLWGTFAQKKAKLVRPPHVTILGVHPSPLSAYRGFLGSKAYSAINRALEGLGQPPIDWRP
ncbi:MAG: uracil-DNA glycosylase [Polyangiales bacterium]